MSIVVNVTPECRMLPVWLTGEIDFDVEMTLGHLKQTTTGIRGGAAKEFDHDWKWACQRFRDGMEAKGNIYVGVPPGTEAKLRSLKSEAIVIDGYVVDGPFLPMKFEASQELWPRIGDDNEVVSRRREESVTETGGKVCYRLMAVFLVKEHIFRRIVARDEEPEMWAAIRNGKKENGLWKPVAVPETKSYAMGVSR